MSRKGKGTEGAEGGKSRERGGKEDICPGAPELLVKPLSMTEFERYLVF